MSCSLGRDSDTFRRSFIAARPHAAARVEATGVLPPESVALHLRRCECDDPAVTRTARHHPPYTPTLTLLSLGLPVVTNAGHLSEAIWEDAGSGRAQRHARRHAHRHECGRSSGRPARAYCPRCEGPFNVRRAVRTTPCGRAEPADAETEVEIGDELGERRALAAMSRLGDRDRELIALRFFADLSHSEIAEVLGISATNAATRLHRAIDKLRRACDENA